MEGWNHTSQFVYAGFLSAELAIACPPSLLAGLPLVLRDPL